MLTVPDQKPISTSVEGSRGAASKESSDRRWYSALSDIGVMFGPTFQTLSDIRTTPDKGEATAKIALHTTRGLMAQESRYIMHPSTLDGCLQLANIAASKGKIKNIDKAFLPVTIEQMTLWKRATKPVVMAPETLNIRCRGHHHGLRSVRGETEIFDDDGRVFLHMKATFASVEGGLSKQGVEKPRQPYLRLIWQPDVERIKGAEIRKLFGSGFDDLKDHTRFERLEELARLCVLDCGKRLPEFELGNQPQNVRHFAQWLRTERSRLLEGPMGNLSAFKYRERIETLISDLGVDMPEARILIELKGKLLEIVTDAPNSADLISEEQFEQIYELGYTRCTASQQLSKLMKLFTHKSPGLRILEVSARTGGATRVMLAALRGTSPQPNYREYTLASLSSTAVSIAQEKFKDFRNMQFRELDVERDPLSQGFEEGYYDFVIATDVSSVVLGKKGEVHMTKQLIPW
jgi:hypothetical protein